MPHLFISRPRQHCLDSNRSSRQQFQWEAINAIVYLIGGMVFIAGSILFLPKFEAYSNLGVVTFIFGSLLYLLVTGHDLLEAITCRRTKSECTKWDNLELMAALIYVVGTILFIVGSIFFLSQIGLTAAGSYCFILGSILFFFGACINVMQITQTSSLPILQLMNATAITFVVGSAIFVFGSIPYLWSHLDKTDQSLVFTLVGWEFIIGSVFFFLGGVFNFIRAYLSYQQHALNTNRVTKSNQQ